MNLALGFLVLFCLSLSPGVVLSICPDDNSQVGHCFATSTAAAADESADTPILRKINVRDAATLTATEWDTGEPASAFDNNSNTVFRSANINPAFIQATFLTAQSVRKIRVLLGQPGYPAIDSNSWRLEAADNAFDLDHQTDSYELVVPDRFDVAGDWDAVMLPESIDKRVWRFTVTRTVGDNYVHIPELELWTEVAVPEGVDLNVTYISRYPRYEWDSDKPWPDIGEAVIFTAHIVNKGTLDSGPFEYAWVVDGAVKAGGVLDSIPPQGGRTVECVWEWETSRHYIAFQADPRNLLEELSDANNGVEDATDALPLAFWVEQSVYDEFNQRENALGTYSWEDWARQIPEQMNWMFDYSRYPLAPRGVLTRVRLDKVEVVPDGTLFNLNFSHAPFETTSDGQWGFSTEEYLGAPEIWLGVPWWVIHELGHQMFGLVDHYGMDVQDIDVDVLDSSGNRIAGTPLLPALQFDIVHVTSRNYELMRSACPYSVLSDHSTYYLNRYWGIGDRTHRVFGAYIHEIPTQTDIRVLDAQDRPLEGVSVAVYQAQAGDNRSGPYSQYFDNTPDIVGTTDSRGILSLGSQPFPEPEPPRDPEQGHILYNIALIELRHPSGDRRYTWLEVVDLNLAHWSGHAGIYVHDVHFPEGDSQLRLSESAVSFSAAQGSTSPDPRNIQVDIRGTTPRFWKVKRPEVSWLRTIPSPDIALGIDGYPPGPLTFIVDSSELPPGVYTTDILVGIDAGPGEMADPQFVQITLTVAESNDIIVPIDIKPGNNRNTINPRAHGSVWVAVLSDRSTGFNPRDIDVTSLRFGPEEAEPLRCKWRDVNKDNIDDLVLRFNIPDTGIVCGDTEAILIGKTLAGVQITGLDLTRTVGCRGK